MIEPLSPNTQAILLLTAPLIIGSKGCRQSLLSPKEYNCLAYILRDNQRQPGDLIGPEAEEILQLSTASFPHARLQALLGRGFLLSQAIEKWQQHSIWVLSRADQKYPKLLKNRLKENAPPVLYGCGDIALLERGGLAVVGSRHADEDALQFTQNIGCLSTLADCTIVSGGAKGIDQAAMQSAVQAGGYAVGVLAHSLGRDALAHTNRQPLMEGRLALISPNDPSASFNVGLAMQRNKLIYALADAALVVASDFEKGGTWAGAIEQIDQLKFVPIYIRTGAQAAKGNAALIQRGGLPWPNPRTASGLIEILTRGHAVQGKAVKQDSPLFQSHTTLPLSPVPIATAAAEQTDPVESLDSPKQIRHPEDELLDAVSTILTRELKTPKTEKEISALLSVSPAQAKAWLTKLVEAAVLEKLTKPVKYKTAQAKLFHPATH